MKTKLLALLLLFTTIVTAIPMMTIFSAAEEVAMADFDYDSLYAKQDYLDTQIDFFSAEESSTPLKSTALGTIG